MGMVHFSGSATPASPSPSICPTRSSWIGSTIDIKKFDAYSFPLSLMPIVSIESEHFSLIENMYFFLHLERLFFFLLRLLLARRNRLCRWLSGIRESTSGKQSTGKCDGASQHACDFPISMNDLAGASDAKPEIVVFLPIEVYGG